MLSALRAVSILVWAALFCFITSAETGVLPAFAADAEPLHPVVEVLAHEWHPDVVWERIGKTKFIWRATVRNNSNERKRVYVYYDLLDSKRVPIARNVTNRYIEPHETVEITADSYILTEDLPKVKSSRAVAKTGF
jgi:hypothetical protein